MLILKWTNNIKEAIGAKASVAVELTWALIQYKDDILPV